MASIVVTIVTITLSHAPMIVLYGRFRTSHEMLAAAKYLNIRSYNSAYKFLVQLRRRDRVTVLYGQCGRSPGLLMLVKFLRSK